MIKFLLDTSSDFTVEEVKAKGMDLVPLHITLGEADYKDAYDLTKDAFYELLTTNEEFPKTSQPTPQDFVDAFEDAKEKGDELICILLSSRLSGTFQSATLAKSIVEYDNIHLVDSLGATHMIRIMVEYAQNLAAEGKGAKEIVEALEEMKSKIKVLAVVDTLEYLCKGGRVSKTTAAIGEAAKVKPMITVANGEVAVIGKSLGKNKAIGNLLKALGECEVDERFPIYSVSTLGTENCEVFEKRLTDAGYSFRERLQIGATIGTHVGPGVFGMIFVTK
ncbi:MAG: DegV family protein [Lachnospiraceae bacterium]|nr:DegV family protein [Lachnospiraceae bacterium]